MHPGAPDLSVTAGTPGAARTVDVTASTTGGVTRGSAPGTASFTSTDHGIAAAGAGTAVGAVPATTAGGGGVAYRATLACFDAGAAAGAAGAAVGVTRAGVTAGRAGAGHAAVGAVCGNSGLTTGGGITGLPRRCVTVGDGSSVGGLQSSGLAVEAGPTIAAGHAAVSDGVATTGCCVRIPGQQHGPPALDSVNSITAATTIATVGAAAADHVVFGVGLNIGRTAPSPVVTGAPVATMTTGGITRGGAAVDTQCPDPSEATVTAGASGIGTVAPAATLACAAGLRTGGQRRYLAGLAVAAGATVEAVSTVAAGPGTGRRRSVSAGQNTA